jgi:pantoate--beta-alanine ligase
MEIISSVSEAAHYSAELKKKGYTIGLVPTLGGLHSGHQLLMQNSREDNDITFISIFLNPMQFRKKKFENYPSDFEQDKHVAQVSQLDMIFHPTIKDMFPCVQEIDDFFKYQEDKSRRRDEQHFIKETKDKNGIDNLISVPTHLVYRLDGTLHPWFFDGAATIVYKLFEVLQPHKAYFGEKDIQQLAILTNMAAAYFPDIKIIGVPTLRDADQLAFSSRNVLLSPEQRQSALSVYHALEHGEQLIRSGESETELVLNAMKAIIETQPLVKIDYIDIVEKKSLQSSKKITGDMILYVAFFVKGIRLTDTIIVNL